MAGAASETTARITSPAEERIGDYTILSRIGSGGMAHVYQVRGPEGRLLALKEMKPQAEARREMTRRFRQEFEVTARLDHANIVRVHDFFPAQDTLHIVMEWVDGCDLRAVLRYAGTLDPGRLAHIGAQVAKGLSSAHEQGILHRDLKPENVLMSRKGRANVADFGVARLQGTRLTATGIILGSPAYMSPEQLAGVSGQRLSAQADIYSFGVLLYELLEGKDPFRLKRHEDLLTVLSKKREKAPTRMRRAEDDDLRELILACLAPEPDQRPSSMQDVARTLNRIARRHKIRVSDVRALVGLAMDNQRDGRKAGGQPAPLPTAEAPSPSEAPSGRTKRTLQAKQTKRPRRSRRPAPPQPVEELEPAQAGQASLRVESTGSHAGRATELSLKRRAAGEGGSAVAWLAFLVFVASVVFFAVSASLTGSPLGLLEQWVQIP